MKSLLPVILVILLLTGAITFALTKSALPKQVDKQETVSPNELEAVTFLTPTATVTPTAIVPKASPTPTTTATKVETSKAVNPTVTIVPTITVKKSLNETKGGVVEADKEEEIISTPRTKTITKTTVCTPVYGSANTCTEHVTVDTGIEQSIFFNLAGVAYLSGLISFIKAKKA